MEGSTPNGPPSLSRTHFRVCEGGHVNMNVITHVKRVTWFPGRS